jgi:hypothetical protein
MTTRRAHSLLNNCVIFDCCCFAALLVGAWWGGGVGGEGDTCGDIVDTLGAKSLILLMCCCLASAVLVRVCSQDWLWTAVCADPPTPALRGGPAPRTPDSCMDKSKNLKSEF